jgi:hypothetical protein
VCVCVGGGGVEKMLNKFSNRRRGYVTCVADKTPLINHESVSNLSSSELWVRDRISNAVRRYVCV